MVAAEVKEVNLLDAEKSFLHRRRTFFVLIPLNIAVTNARNTLFSPSGT